MPTKDNMIPGDKKRQKYLGEKGLIVFIAFLSAFIPLSTDLYLPALPGMVKYFNAPVNLVNLTLVLFFVFFSIGTILWGPLSDKYGRKPILLLGLILYTISSFLCVYSENIYQLITFRVFQAIGCSSAGAVSMAIVKDVYSGRKREVVLSVVQSMVMLGPAVAPVIGAFLLNYTPWRGAFWLLAGAGILALAGCIAMEETIENRYKGTILQTMGRLGVVLKNPGFTSLLILFSVISIPFMAYIASSSYIYVNEFGLSEQSFSYYFAVNALFLLFGPIIYMKLSRRFKRNSIIIFCFTMMTVGGLLICGLGTIKPWVFAVTLLPATIAGSIIRPPSAVLMLEQQQTDTGSASSLMGCFGIFMGSVGMFLISFDWSNIILTLGLLNLITGLVCGVFWLMIVNKPFIKQVPDQISDAGTMAG
ncbi:MFS transporter, DHA1 family, bicyclomycin/chloramphenicol resistance protein [Desulfotomaculum arcticum]|uniref:Bcr/CflA family efflux transporter n=1 Tax=Desulfotruncus arcticus DSM 17038 TaxID=1121424 RepID=A0A1I2V7C9_9FIRM|nr:multidrug effflux MFS transporter [Desulfotruncus arcticus]SFG85030.1 MFS transporter, DHA1 family, bicyclomycin/chloramphenicol resistance protein [Desulfotomaculum arcticum] [Desulfotruncus arcticus DSM 17038]